jgi:thioredoxin 1
MIVDYNQFQPAHALHLKVALKNIKDQGPVSRGGVMPLKKILNTDHFESVIKNGVTLVDFNAQWCSPCRAQEPIIEKLSKKFKGRTASVVLDVDDHHKIAMQLGIASIPTLIIFKNVKEVKRFVGLQVEKTLSDAIEKTLQ